MEKPVWFCNFALKFYIFSKRQVSVICKPMATANFLPPLFYNNEKRFVLRFNLFTDKVISKSITEYDTLEEAMEEIRLIHECYQNTPKPERKKRGKYASTYDIFFPTGAMFWGYILLDYQENKIIKIGNDGLFGGIGKRTDPLILMDYFFRKPEDVPKDYKWDLGEFDGWLQFKWGNGKNAINYKEIKEEVKKRTIPVFDEEEVDPLLIDNDMDPQVEELEEKYDEILDKELKIMKDYKW